MLYNLYNNYNRINSIWDTINEIQNLQYNDENLSKIIDLIGILEKNIVDGGCIYVKFMQWYISNLKAKNCNGNEYTETNNLLITHFEYIFNNCKTHELSYTKSVFYNDFGIHLDDYVTDLELIASGSIGQVYKGIRKIDKTVIVIKVKHPEIDDQVEEFKQLGNFIVTLQQYSFIRRRYKLNFNFKEFINDLQLQSDFNVEVANNNKFRRLYRDNNEIYFPEVYINSRNIIISEYMNIIDINELTDYNKFKIVLNLSCFLYDMILIKNFIHSDLHSKNWGIIKDPATNNYRLLVLDCALCISSEDINHNIQLMNSVESLASKEQDTITNIINSLKNFIEIEERNEPIVEKMIKDNIVHDGIKTIYILKIVNYLIDDQNLIMDTFIVNMLLALVLAEEFLKKENMMNCNGGESTYKSHTKNIYMDMYTFSNKKNSYNDLGQYIKNILNKDLYKNDNNLFGKPCSAIKFSQIE